MNKIYRVVWNNLRRCLMVVSEQTKSNGKTPATSVIQVRHSVAAALVALGAGSANANLIEIPGSPYVYDTTLVLNTGDSLNVAANGSVGGAVATAVRVFPQIFGDYAFGSITNSGTLIGNYAGISINSNMLPNPNDGKWYLDPSVVLGDIVNIGGRGFISGRSVGVVVAGSTVVGMVLNAGTIQGGLTGIYAFNSSLESNIVNVGVIRGAVSGLALSASDIGYGILNVYIKNFGSISGRTALSLVNGSNLTGSIINDGFLLADAFGLQIAQSTVSGDVLNQGLISAKTAISLSHSSVSGGITNTGFIGAGIASIQIFSSTLVGGVTNAVGGTLSGAIRINKSAVNIANDGLIFDGRNDAIVAGGGNVSLNNSPTGSIVGLIVGVQSITNRGLLALQGYANGAIIAGSHVNAYNVGSFRQESGGTLSIGVSGVGGSGTLSGNYSQLFVDNMAVLDGSTINVSPSSTDAILAGGTLSGVIVASTISASNVTITDKRSALLDFISVVSGGNLDLVAITSPNYCGTNLSGMHVGHCEVGSDAPSLTVATTGSIGGGLTGIKVLSGVIATGSILNSGTITAANNAIEVIEGSTYTGGIANTGVIRGLANGVFIHRGGSLDSLLNMGSGSISSVNNDGFLGRFVMMGGEVSSGLTNSGVIASSSGPIWIMSGATLHGGILNTGVVGLGSMAYGRSGLEISSSGLVSEGIFNKGGTINGASNAIALINSQLLGGLTNTGLLVGTVGGISIKSAGSISGGLNNAGIIRGGQAGLQMSLSSGLTGGLTNSGLIAGSFNAIYVDGTSRLDRIVIAGNNSASFSGAVVAPNTPVTVAGGAKYTLDSNFTVSGFSNEGALIVAATARHGTITGNYNQAAHAELDIKVNGTSGSGAISGNYGQLVVTGTATLNGGWFSAGSNLYIDQSSVTALTAGQTLAGVVNAGTLVASGLSISDNLHGLDFVLDYATLGGLLNIVAVTSTNSCAGTIGDARTGPCEVAIDAPVLNVLSTGLIEAATKGVIVHAGSIVGSIVNAGRIIGSNTGIAFHRGATLTGGLTNTGLIAGGMYGIQMDGANLQGGLQNMGTIAGSARIYQSNIDGGLNNTGLIEGGIALQSVAMITGGLQNSGLISNAQSAISVNGLSQLLGGVTNTGLLVGTVAGISIKSAGSISGGLNNAGIIRGGQTGLQMTLGSGLTGGLTNSGLIAGGFNAIYVDGTSTLDRIVIAGNNSASFSGAVVAPNTPVTLSGGAQYTLDANFSVNSFSNQGVLIVPATNSHGTITGNYNQVTGADLDVKVNGTSGSGAISGNYGQLVVTGAATLNRGSVYIDQSSATAVMAGQTLVGVIASGTLTANGLSITDNLHNIDFIQDGSTASGGLLNIIAVASANSCAGTIGDARTGPCEVAIDAPVLNVLSTGSIGGASKGVIVHAGNIVGSIVNAGTIIGSNTGIAFHRGATLTGGLTNSGLIAGGTSAVYVDPNASLDRIVIAGNNTAAFVGAVVAPKTMVTVAGGAVYTLSSNFQVATFSNEGTLIVTPAVTPTITGNLAFQNSGIFMPTVNTSTSYATLNVTGHVSIAGTLQVDNVKALSNTTIIGLIRGGGLDGSFGNVVDNSYLNNFVPIYGANQVDLAVVNDTEHSIYRATNEQGNLAGLGSGATLDNIRVATSYMPNVIATFNQMNSASQISNAVSQTLPVLSGASVWNTLSVLSSINRIIESRHLFTKGISSGDSFQGNSSLWMKPFGAWTNQSNQNGAYGFSANTGGLLFGGETQFTEYTKLGAGFGWGNTYTTSNASVASQSQTSNLYQFIGYGSYALTENLDATFQANGGWNSNSSQRSIGFMGTSAQGSYNSAVWHVGAGLNRLFSLTEQTSLIPSARFDYTWIRNQGYTETGATNGLGLNVNGETYQTTVLGADVKVMHRLNDHHLVNANVGMGYNFSPTQISVVAAFQGASTMQFTTYGVNPSSVMGRAGLGYTYKIKEDVDVGVRYDLDFQNGYTNQTATLKGRWNF